MAIAATALVSTAAVAAEIPRRQACAKVEPQRGQPPLTAQQQRARAQECRATRNIPPLVDPTPFFLL